MKKESSRRHYIIVNMPYLLLHILIKYKALDAYISNLLHGYKYRNDLYTYKYINSILNTKPISRILITSFSWDLSKEGYKFWFDIYNDICDNQP